MFERVEGKGNEKESKVQRKGDRGGTSVCVKRRGREVNGENQEQVEGKLRGLCSMWDRVKGEMVRGKEEREREGGDREVIWGLGDTWKKGGRGAKGEKGSGKGRECV